jgi:ApbE superfamily uncharacterized protein (UPF0280 family)
LTARAANAVLLELATATIASRPQATRRSGPGAHSGAVRCRLADGRWHFQHGPIDLIIGADGPEECVARALERAWPRFEGVLVELTSELDALRQPVERAGAVQGAIARQMIAACLPHSPVFITPMAAVAGAVADAMIEFFRAEQRIRRAYVNNGGDIALHLTAGTAYAIGLGDPWNPQERVASSSLAGRFEITSEMPVRGVATSGWRGRSFSLGIADSVSVLARSAAEADAAATLLANAVNVDDPAILRKPACELKDDTDLGARLVTVKVGALPASQVEVALAAGVRAAQGMRAHGLIDAAVLRLQGRSRVVGPGQT